MNYNHISIKKRLALGFSTITLITVLLGLFTIFEFKKEAELVDSMFNHPYTVSNAVQDIHTDFMIIHTLVQSIISNNNTDFVNNQIKKIDIYDKKINDNFQTVFQRYLGDKRDVNKAFEMYKQTVAEREKLINLINNSNPEDARNIMQTDCLLKMDSFQERVIFLGDFADNKANEFLNNAKQKEKETITLLIIFILVLVFFTIIISVVITKSIVNPLNTLLTISEKINKGDLSVVNAMQTDTLINRHDELGQLFNSFNTLLTHLLIPYNKIIKTNRPLVEMTDEVRRLLDSFDKNIIASKTDVHGKIIYASKAFSDISGYETEELIGKNQNLVRHQDMPPFVFKELWETIKDGKTWTGDIKNKTKDGGFFWIKAHISPDIDINGNIIGYNAINENITLKKAFEHLTNTLEERIAIEMKKNNEKTNYLLQQSRLAQMGEMINMIAHQWRQPLASISAISGTLSLDIMMDDYNAEFFQDRLESIGELSQHLSSTIDDFRGFFKEDKEKEVSEIKTLINDSINIIDQTLKSKNINLIVNYTHNPKIKSHLNEIKQVILNLIKNAEDILIIKNIEEAKIWINAYEEDENVFISVADNAGGIPEDIMDKVFDPYFSTKKEKDGTGLGLYMSKTIIEEHCSGKLYLQNTNDGALFTIKLPIYHK